MSRQISQLIDKAIELPDTGISMSKDDKNRLIVNEQFLN